MINYILVLISQKVNKFCMEPFLLNFIISTMLLTLPRAKLLYEQYCDYDNKPAEILAKYIHVRATAVLEELYIFEILRHIKIFS